MFGSVKSHPAAETHSEKPRRSDEPRHSGQPYRAAETHRADETSATTFADLRLDDLLLRAVAEEGYEAPTPVQAQAIPHLIEGRDLLGRAQTGSGKTAAFALPIIQKLAGGGRPAPRTARALVVTPTRELAAQIGESFRVYGRHVRLSQALVYGGVKQGPQVKALSRGVEVLVATPGRLLDLVGQRHVRLDAVEVFVLDEADRMLDMGFIPDVRRIVALLPARRQTLFFSATMPPRARQLADEMLTSPVVVDVAPQRKTADNIDQKVMLVERDKKRDLLRHVLASPDVVRALVFTRTKHRAESVARHLKRAGLDAEAIHGDRAQAARERALEGFRKGRTRVLVATDVASRGIDVDGISHVINFEIPDEPGVYVHRIGRTARAGAAGVAYSFCEVAERSDLHAIEKLIGRQLEIVEGHAFASSIPYVSAPPRAARATARRAPKLHVRGRPRRLYA